jgi:hypothetical protein
MPVMVLSKKTGQLGNRLTVYAHCLAAAHATGWRLHNPAFAEYSDFFVGPRLVLSACAATRAKPPSPRLRAAAYAAGRVLWEGAKLARWPSLGRVRTARARNEEHLDLKAVIDEARAGGCRLLVLQGYHFRHHGWFAPHADAVRAFLAPAEPWATAGARAVADLRARAGADAAVVGVHIRHGDYQQHLGGRFFWPVATYAGFMRRMADLLAPRPVAFLVCSNAAHQGDDFAGMTHAFGPGHLVSDMHALSRCDFLLGPPSSFSSWAAFHGGARLLRIEDPAAPITLDRCETLATPDPWY